MPGIATAALESSTLPLVGRADVHDAAIATLRHPETRLLTITGTAGVGKTRLALELHQTLASEFRGGTFLIDLTTLDSPAQLDAELARTVGLQSSRAPERITEIDAWLAQHDALLILDNAEHIVGIGPRVVEWVAANPRVRIIVTSRQRLRLSIEIELELRPLDVWPPDATEDGSIGPLSPAAVLFAAMAGCRQPERLPPATRVALERIVARLDGLPLAMELIAAQLPHLTADAIAELQANTEKINTAMPSVASTLDLAVRRSYALLSPNAQALLRYLTVCNGGFSLELAELIVIHVRGRTPVPFAVTDGLEELYEHHLIQVQESQLEAPRFDMLTMVAEAIGSRRQELGETATCQRAHAFAMIDYAERREYAGLRPKHEHEIGELALNYHNLTSAISWLNRNGETEAELRLVGALTWLWYTHGHYADGLAHFERVLARDVRREGRAWARFLTGYGILLDILARFDDAHRQLRSALAAYEAVGLPEGLASTSIVLGFNAFHRDRFDEAESALEQAIHHAANSRDRELGRALEAIALSNLGANAHEQRRLEHAERALRRAIDTHDSMRYQWGAARARCDLGGVLRDAGKLDEAIETYHAVLEPARQLGDFRLIAVALAGIATVLARDGQMPLAAWLFGGVDAMQPVAGTPSFLKANETAWQDARALARDRIGNRVWKTAHSAGLATSVDDLIAVARGVIRVAPDSFAPPSQPLTRQEHTVLELVVQGLPTRLIGSTLGITERTVSSHLGALFRKHQVNSRLELTAVVTRHRDHPGELARPTR